MLFIYWLEDHPQLANRVNAIRSRMEQRQDQLITSAFTFGEVLAGTIAKVLRIWRKSRAAYYRVWSRRWCLSPSRPPITMDGSEESLVFHRQIRFTSLALPKRILTYF
jgi:hypothetical protein